MNNLNQDKPKPRKGTLNISVKFKFGVGSGAYDEELNQLKEHLKISKNSNTSRSILHKAITDFFKRVNTGPPELKSFEEDDPFMHVIEDPDDPR